MVTANAGNPIRFLRRVGGFQGQASDIQRHAEDILKIKKRLNDIYVRHTGKDYETIERTLDRDHFIHLRHEPPHVGDFFRREHGEVLDADADLATLCGRVQSDDGKKCTILFCEATAKSRRSGISCCSMKTASRSNRSMSGEVTSPCTKSSRPSRCMASSTG